MEETGKTGKRINIAQTDVNLWALVKTASDRYPLNKIYFQHNIGRID